MEEVEQIDDKDKIKTWTNAKGMIQAEIKITAPAGLWKESDIEEVVRLHKLAWDKLKQAFPKALLIEG